MTKMWHRLLWNLVARRNGILLKLRRSPGDPVLKSTLEKIYVDIDKLGNEYHVHSNLSLIFRDDHIQNENNISFR